MIHSETILINGREFIHTYSTSGVKIRGGMPEADYDEATDPVESGRIYTETDIPIDTGIDDQGEKASNLVDALLGE